MAGDVANMKVCSPLNQRSGLTGKKPAICHYSYNLPLATIIRDEPANRINRLTLYKFKKYDYVL